LSINCEVCSRPFVPKYDMKRVFVICSESCRSKANKKRSTIKDIESGNWHKMNVSTIEALGFIVTVTKKTVEVSSTEGNLQ